MPPRSVDQKPPEVVGRVPWFVVFVGCHVCVLGFHVTGVGVLHVPVCGFHVCGVVDVHVPVFGFHVTGA
jgi:hypothetical protein